MINKNIMYFTRTMGLGGTEKVILQLCKNFNAEFNKIIVCSSGGVHESELKKLGIKHYKIDDIENKNPISMLKTLKFICKIVKSEKIDIIHTHHRMAAFYTSILRKLIKFKFIHTSHNTFSDKKFFSRLSLKNSNIIAVGEKVKENLCGFYGLDSDKVTVIYNGIEKDNNEIVELPQIKKYRERGYFIIGNIGRLSEQKGMEYYIKAIPQVLKENNKFMFFIVGEGEDKDKLKNLVDELKINENIIFLGYRDDVTNVIKQFDLIVLTSLWEGLPLTPIEAFSLGKTVIGTDVDGTGEIINHMKNGILIKPKNVNEIAENILTLYKDRELKKYLEENAYITYEKGFSYEKFIAQYEGFYQNGVGSE